MDAPSCSLLRMFGWLFFRLRRPDTAGTYLRTRLMKDLKDITQILYQIAVTAGVLILAF